MKQIFIKVDDDGILDIKNVPVGIEIVVDDGIEDTQAVFGEGDNNILLQKI